MTAPLVTVLAVRIIRDLGYEPSILGLLLTTFGIGTVGGALLTARLSSVVMSGWSCSVAIS